MTTPIKKLMLAAFAAFTLCLGAGALEQDTDGYYMLGSVQDWQGFAALIETTPTANAKMIADIDLGDDQTRIGTVLESVHTHKYKGVFDGQGYTLTVNYVVSAGNDLAAPFAKVEGATIQNLHVTGTINSTGYHPCCFVADSWGTTTISNVWGSVNITSTGGSWIEAGGIVGCMKGGSLALADCLFTGTVNGSGTYNGCFVGWGSGSTTINNSLSTGTFTYSAGGNAFRGTHVNCYVTQFPTTFPDGVTQPTYEELADGTTVTSLQAGREAIVWVQEVLTGQPMLATFIREKKVIAWLNDDGTEIDTTEVYEGSLPTHAEPTKAAAAPYRWVFTGWTPELEAAVSNATYTATFKIVADLSLCTNDWTAADGDEIVGETTHKVTIPGGATVTINGVEVAGAVGGGTVPAPAFAEGGASEIVKFAQAEGGKWTITAFAEMSNESRGTDVTDGQIKVYSADTLEALKSVTTPAAGATVKETKSAVKATVEVPAPSGKTSQFFKVKFGE